MKTRSAHQHVTFLWRMVFPFAFLLTIALIFFPSSSIYLIQTALSPHTRAIEMEQEQVVATYNEDDTVFMKMAAFLVNKDNPEISKIPEVQVTIRKHNQQMFKSYTTEAHGDFSKVVPLDKVKDLESRDMDYDYEIRGEGILMSSGTVQLLVKAELPRKNPITLRIIEILALFSALLYISEWLRRKGVW